MIARFGLAFVLISGCAHAPVDWEPPAIILGTVANPEFTGWFRDWCDGGKLVPSIDSHIDCLQIGGEIYRARLLGPHNLSGQRVASELEIAYPAHALSPRFRVRTEVYLQPAPPDFVEATGIRFFATYYGFLDQSKTCVLERGYGHTDNSLCPDTDFHVEHSGECIPIGEFTAYYAAGT